MQIRIGFDIVTRQKALTPMVLLLHARPELVPNMVQADDLQLTPEIPVHLFTDSFGNRSARIIAPAGELRFFCEGIIEDDGKRDLVVPDAIQHPIEDLPDECLPYLLASRYCEVDKLSDFAWEQFGSGPLGWARVQAVSDFVHHHVTFGYNFARSTKSALDVFEEKNGVCRDYQHLAVTFCRALGIPARYATGYLSDIGAPTPAAMDFSAWFEAYLGGRWYTFDARFNTPRIGRILMAVGRDAADCALLTTFGSHRLEKFVVVCEPVDKSIV